MSDWNRDPDAAVIYLDALRVSNQHSYGQLISMYKKMATGGNGGQVEAWSFASIRDEYYSNWSDEDFVNVLTSLGEKAGLDSGLRGRNDG